MAEELIIRVIFDYQTKGGTSAGSSVSKKPLEFDPNSIAQIKKNIAELKKEYERLAPSTDAARQAYAKYNEEIKRLSDAEQSLVGTMKNKSNILASTSYTLQSLNYTIRDSVYFAKDFQLGLLAVGNNLNPLIDGLIMMKMAAKSAGTTMKAELLASLMGPQGVVFGFTILVSILQAVTFAMAESESAIEKEKSELEKLAEVIDELARKYNKAKYSKIDLDKVLSGGGIKTEDAILQAQREFDKRVADLQKETKIKVKSKEEGEFEITRPGMSLAAAYEKAFKELSPEKKKLLTEGESFLSKVERYINILKKEGSYKLKEAYETLSDVERQSIQEFFQSKLENWTEENNKFLEKTTLTKKQLEILAGKDKESKEDKFLEIDADAKVNEYIVLGERIRDVVSDYKASFGQVIDDKDIIKINELVSALQRLGVQLSPSEMDSIVEKFKTTLEKLPIQRYGDVFGTQIQPPNKMEQVREKYKKPEIEFTEEELQKINLQMDLINTVANQVGSSIANAFMQGKLALDEFIKGLIAAIGQLLIVKAITSLLGFDSGGIAEKKANGGIVGAENGIIAGESYWGDRMLIGVNSGEMILNKQQQQKLFNMIANPSVSVNQRPVFVFKNLLKGQKFVLETNKSLSRSAR